MKKIIIYLNIVLMILIIILALSGCRKEESISNAKCKMQIIEIDIGENTNKIVEEIEIKNNDIISMSKYKGNDIKILEINDEGVKILREKKSYKIINENLKLSKQYEEKIKQDIKYNEAILVNIDEHDPFGPVYCQARYSYYVKYIK